METWEKFAVGVLCVIAAFAAYLMFFLVPVAFYAEAECLRAGYPRSHVTIGLERYCSNLAGSVTVKVDKASGK